MVRTTRSTVGLILDRVPLKLLVTHTAPAPTATPLGVESTWIVWTSCLAGSIRETVLLL